MTHNIQSCALLLVIIYSSCSWLSSPEDNLPRMSVEDIKREYRIVDSLNVLSFNNELDTSKIDRYVTLGMDERNDLVVVRRCEDRLFGCMLTYNVFGLFYEDCDSLACTEAVGTRVIDYEGIAGSPRFIGYAPDTS